LAELRTHFRKACHDDSNGPPRSRAAQHMLRPKNLPPSRGRPKKPPALIELINSHAQPQRPIGPTHPVSEAAHHKGCYGNKPAEGIESGFNGCSYVIMMKRCVFVAGGTGYLGRPLIERLLTRGHEVRALARAGSERRLPVGCQVIAGNALDPNSYVGE